jgi:hypothetical protein
LITVRVLMTGYVENDSLTAALAALTDEVAAVDSFDRARDVVVDLIEVRADVEAVYEALDEVFRRLETIRSAYSRLETLMVAAGWSMERPTELPLALRQALETQVPQHEQHLARTAEAGAVIETWLAQQGWGHCAQRYSTARHRTEKMHSRRARRRRRGEGGL